VLLKTLHVDHWNLIYLTGVSKTDNQIKIILEDAAPQKVDKFLIEI
jgi:hypothetical protein